MLVPVGDAPGKVHGTADGIACCFFVHPGEGHHAKKNRDFRLEKIGNGFSEQRIFKPLRIINRTDTTVFAQYAEVG
jgi:hypothetical protein